jgi:hypothetical protein
MRSRPRSRQGERSRGGEGPERHEDGLYGLARGLRRVEDEGVGEDRTGGPGPTNQRVTVPEAAELLGITAEAVRMRVKRGTLRSERQGGRVFVLLGQSQPTEHTTERTGPTEDRQLRYELIDTLREQLSEERQAHAEARRLLMAALERIPQQLEAPRESPQTAAEPSEGAEPRPYAGGPQEGAQPRPRTPWWRRVLGR